jgi:superfamily II DNA or RNA helicase
MNTRIANRIFVEDPTDEVVEWVETNLKFPNPAYEEKQRMGFWVGRTPKELRLYEWNGNQLILPFGVVRELMPMLRGTLVTTGFKQDSVIDYGHVDMGLRDYQKEAVDAMVAAKYGVLTSKPGSGKTQMGIALIQAFRRRALWLCHTADLLNQSLDRARMYMDEGLLGTITEGKVNAGVGVTFATVQTMANLELTQYRDWWDVVIVDECHRVASSAETFTRYEKVLNHLAARHKIGLTATPERSDGLIKATFALLGNVAHAVPDSAVADNTTGVIVKMVGTGVEINEEKCLNEDGTINYVKLLAYLTEHEGRNRMIAEKMVENRGHSCLVLSDRLAQLEEIIGMLPEDMRKDAAFINGKMQSKTAKEERKQAIEDMREGKKKYLFASYSLSKEGLDIPRLDRLFLASPAKFSAVITQAVGRVQRVFPGKETPVVYDFVDDIGFCMGAFKKRCTSYRKIGAVIEK